MTLAQVYHQEGRKEGRKEGRQEGRKEGRQEAILEALEIRFGAIPDGLAEAVRAVDDAERLRALQHSAIRCASLEEFSMSL